MTVEPVIGDMTKFIDLQQRVSVLKDKAGPGNKFKFRDAMAIYQACKPILKENKAIITLSDRVIDIVGKPFLESTAHYRDSNFEISVTSSVLIDINPNPKVMTLGQASGSTASYGRKYALEGLLLLDNNKDLDEIDPADNERVKNQERIDLEKDYEKACNDSKNEKAIATIKNIDNLNDDQLRNGINKLKGNK